MNLFFKQLLYQLFCLSVVYASDIRLNLSPQVVKEHNLYWSNGVKLGVQSAHVLNNDIELTLQYHSSRFGSGLTHKNVFVTNYVLGGLKYYFREGTLFSPYLLMHAGYYNYELSEDDPVEAAFSEILSTESTVWASGFGVQTTFLKRFSLYADMGYNIIQDANLLYPLFFTLGFTYNVEFSL